jgi:hypothetical protein
LTKKGKKGNWFLLFYARFLTIRTITMPTMKTAKIMAITAGTKYVSTSDFSATGAAVAVFTSGITEHTNAITIKMEVSSVFLVSLSMLLNLV